MTHERTRIAAGAAIVVMIALSAFIVPSAVQQSYEKDSTFRNQTEAECSPLTDRFSARPTTIFDTQVLYTVGTPGCDIDNRNATDQVALTIDQNETAVVAGRNITIDLLDASENNYTRARFYYSPYIDSPDAVKAAGEEIVPVLAVSFVIVGILAAGVAAVTLR